MKHRKHHYQATIRWTGNTGSGTTDYESYERNHSIIVKGKPEIHSSADPAFRGNPDRHNPEELFLASISSCHMLWYLHLCAEHGVVVQSYEDKAKGIMIEESNGKGRFTEVVLNPCVVVHQASMAGKAKQLHQLANEMCFIANSCNFEILHRPIIEVAE